MAYCGHLLLNPKIFNFKNIYFVTEKVYWDPHLTNGLLLAGSMHVLLTNIWPYFHVLNAAPS